MNQTRSKIAGAALTLCLLIGTGYLALSDRTETHTTAHAASDLHFYQIAAVGEAPAWMPILAMDNGRTATIVMPAAVGDRQGPPLPVIVSVGPDGRYSPTMASFENHQILVAGAGPDLALRADDETVILIRRGDPLQTGDIAEMIAHMHQVFTADKIVMHDRQGL